MFRKIISIILILIMFFFSESSAKALQGLVKFSGKGNLVVFLEIADTDEKKSKGLMSRPDLPQDRGMVFVFRPAKEVTFWMKDTLISLDIIFINQGKIVKIVKAAEPNQTHTLYSSDFNVTEVIEVNGGFTDKNMISVGSKVSFENIAQIDYSGKSKLMIVAK
ncbi:MAG: DUF192 domain-containing protein [Candidatus Melainabacteria bacterium]|nr:DUF192 domain-containing protein [Candidatus Melainabacteria bacterium]